ncbi:histidine kinase [Tumidithrix helvetica PCC 7403]|uniref:PAS domain S-box protein n=1 Tax=Tumidithrix helvetica TaxID=3457545 RepID=UPI003CBF4435
MSTPTTTLTQIELKSAIVQNPLVINAETTVMEAIAKMSETRTICASDRSGDSDNVHLEARSSCVLVMEGGKVVGIMTERDIVRLSAQQRSLDTVTVREVMASPVVTLQETDFTDLFSAVNLLQQRRIRHMPVLDRNDRLLGIITHESLRQLARPVDLLRLRLVSEVMTANVVCADPSTSMLEIAQIMAERRVGSVLIVETQIDPEGNPWQIPLGITTERDIVQFQSLGLQLERVEVRMVMSAPVFAVRPGDTLMVVQQVMEQRSIRRLVVTGTQGELLGVVTQTSLLHALNPLELYTLSKILEQKVSQLEAEKLKLMENYTAELEQQVAQRTADLHAKFEREQLIAKIAAKIAASLNLPEILEASVQALRSFLGCDRMLIWQFQPDWTGAIVAESVGAGWRAALHDVIDDPCFRGDIALRYGEGRTIAIANIYTAGYPNCYIQLLETYQVKANLVVPIHVSGKLWGLSIGHQCADYREWQDTDLLLLNEMAVQIAIAIQQAMAHQLAQTELAERQRAEVALRDSEQRFRAIFNNSFQLLGLLSLDGTLLEINQTALRVGGILYEEVVGRPFWETYWWQISPEAQGQLQQAIARAAQGEFVRYEVDVWGVNQTIVPIDFSLRPIFDDSDRVVLLIPEGRDLRETKRRELELKQSEQRFESLAVAAPVGIFRTDDLGNCLYVNDRWCQIAGLTPEEAAGFGWIDGIHPSDRELVSAEWNASVEENRPFSLEYRFLNQAGQITWGYGQAVAERNEFDEIIGYVGTITDISDRKYAEEQALHRLDILEVAKDIIASTDSVGKVIYLNRAGRALLGIALDEDVSQTHIPDYHSPQIADFILQEAIPQCVQKGFWAGETRFRRRDGSEFPVLQTIVCHRQRDGTISHYSTIARDISDRKQAEAALQQLNQELEIKVEQRTAALKASEATNRATLEAIPDLLLRLRRDGTCAEYIRPGIRADNFIPVEKHISEVLPPELLQNQLQIIEQAILTKELQVYEHQFCKRDRMVYEEIRIVAINDREVLAIVRDISDRKIAEAALAASEAFNRQLVEEFPVGLASCRMDGQLVYVNSAFAKILGRTIEETLALTYWDITPTKYAEQEAVQLRLLQQHGRYGPYEKEYIHKDGHLVPVLLTGLIVQQNGEELIWSSVQDISDRKQAELERQQLFQELSNFKIALDRSAIVAITDARGVITNVNDRLCEISGYAREELLGQTHRIINSGYHPPSFFQNLWQTITSGEIWRGEICNRAKNGSLYWMESTIVPFLDEQGRPWQYLAIRFDITERKQAELAVQESEARFRYLADHAPVLIWMSGLDTLCFHFNKTWLDFTGRTMEQEFGNGWTEGVHPDDFQFCLDVYSTSFEMRQSFEMEYRLRRFDGEYRWLLDTGIPRFDADGEFLGYIGSCLDISDRKQAEQEILENQRFIQKIAEASPNILYLYDLQEHCNVYSNREIATVLGYTPTEIQAMGSALFANLMHPEDLARIPDYYQQIEADREGEIFEIEYRMRHANGEWRWLYSRDTVFSRDDRGKIKLTIGTAQDISDRKQAEEDLRNLSDRLMLAVKSGAIAIWDWNVTENILTWDDRMYELYGITPDRFTSVYNAWASSLHPDDRPIAETAIQTALTGEKDYDPEFRVVHPDGNIRYIKAYALVQRNDRGEPQHMIGVNLDITDRKLAESKLLQTTAQLEASNRELEAFAYSVSHDLRSPLRAIDGFSNALIEDYGDRFDEDARDYFDRIRRNIQRMGMLIDDLLRLSRVSRSEMQFSPVNLSALIQEQMDEMQASEPERQVTFVIAPNIVVTADPTLMHVIISNLVQNAWKFTSHHATARIEFGVLQQDEQLTYFVRDNGAGFDMAFAKMLFGVFQRLHNTNEFPGTGIGLATVQRAIHRHGGRVWAEGVVEQGATIYFTVPNTLIRTGA